MANKKNTKQTRQDAVPTPEVSSIVSGEQELVWSPEDATPRYVVVRSGLRVSDKDYPRSDEPKAIAEKNFWQKVVSRHPDGTKVAIVLYDKKKHRIW